MNVVLPIMGWVAAGVVLGVLGAHAMLARRVISAGRSARAPVCDSCPFVTAEQREEILSGQRTEATPPLRLPMLDGSGLHRPV